MEFKDLLIILCILFVMNSAFALDFTPQGDINLRGIYAIENGTNITAEYFIGDGSLLTSINAGTVNYSDLNNSPTNLSQFTDDLGNRGYNSLSNFTNDIDLINSSYANSTYILQSSEADLNVNHSVSSDASTSTTFWASVSSFIADWFYDNGNVFTFNTTKLLEFTSFYNDSATIQSVNDSLNSRIDTVNASLESINLNYSNINNTPTLLSQFTDDLGDRSYTSLSNFTDDLGDRGYTHLTNFTDDLDYSDKNVNSSLFWDSISSQSQISNLIDAQINSVAWTSINDSTYPSACPAGSAVTQVGDSITCSSFTIDSQLQSVNSSKLDITDQRYNDTAAIALKLDITDQRYNDTALANAKALPGSCASGTVVQNTTTSGVQCVAVSAGGSGNPFDQSLNTTDTVSFATLSVTDNDGLNVANKISHIGDTDTYLEYATDQINVVAGSEYMMWFDETTQNVVTVNGLNTDIDFRIDGDTNDYLLQADANLERIGIGTSTPTHKLHVVGDVNITGNLYGGNISGGSSFDQDLNTFNNVQFGNITMGERLNTKYANTYFYVNPSLERIYQYIGGKQVYYATATSVQLNGGSDDLDIQINSNGRSNIFIADAGLRDIIINEFGANDVNFRVEGDTDVNLIYTDPVNDRVGIGTSTPTQKLEVSGTSSTIRVGNLSGTGNAYVCVDADGDLYRSATACS